MPPKEELLVPFENVVSFWCRRKRVSLEWRVIDHMLFVRPQGAECEMLWQSNRGISATHQPEQEREVAEKLDSAYGGYWYSFRRLVLFSYGEGTEEVWLMPTHNRSCGLIRQESNKGVSWNARFDWKGDYLSFLSAPLEFFLQNVSRAVENRPEHWQRALHWTRLGADDRFWSCVSWKSGDKEEWQALVQALFQLVLSQLPPDASRHWSPFKLIHPRFAFAPLRMMRGPHQKDFPESVWALLALVENYFGAQIDYRHVIESGKSPYINMFLPRPIKVQSSSQHELMAALDLWREFGRKSGQLAEVEGCLRALLT